jgi:hypothetical protein
MRTTPDANLPGAEVSDAEAPGQDRAGGKLRWRTPTAEEVPFTRTEAGGGPLNFADFAIYGS